MGGTPDGRQAGVNAATAALPAPVALFAFNRPEHTRRVLAEIRSARPQRLYLVCDGPREGRPGEAARCEEVRALLTAGVDWPCEVRANFSATNLGCGRRVASGVSWVFEQEAAAIFLEDDCLPDPSFFRFSAELLERYREEVRVGQICGSTFVAPRISRAASYTFSRYGPVWGWASWRRAWQNYDFNLGEWPAARADGWVGRVSVTKREASWRRRIYDDVSAGQIDTWDYQWGFAKMRRSLLSIIPVVNLVENIGFSGEGAHHHGNARALARSRIDFPLIHPVEVESDAIFDRAYSDKIAPSLGRRIRNRLGLLRPGP
jgi:hypothetical protein